MATPFSFDSVVGIVRSIEAVTPQTAGDDHVRVRLVVRWRRSDAQHLDAGGGHDLHGDVSGAAAARAPAQGLSATYFDNVDFTGATLSRGRPDGELHLGFRRAGGGIGADTFSVALDRPGRAAVHGDLHVLHAQRRRRAAVGERAGDRQQLDGSRHGREQRHDRADRRTALRHQDGVLRARRERRPRGCCGAARQPRRPSVPTGRLFPAAQSSTTIRINFQTAPAAVPSGYLPDAGAVYGPRGDGQTYGWLADNSPYGRDRNAQNSADQRYDTFTHLQWPSNSRNAVWEIAVPNGTHVVRIVAGDPLYYDSLYRIAAEGIPTVNGTPSSAVRWVEGTATVTVSDGRLTIGSYTGASNNKICFIEITSQ